eukprot:gene2767-12641_t
MPRDHATRVRDYATIVVGCALPWWNYCPLNQPLVHTGLCQHTRLQTPIATAVKIATIRNGRALNAAWLIPALKQPTICVLEWDRHVGIFLNCIPPPPSPTAKMLSLKKFTSRPMAAARTIPIRAVSVRPRVSVNSTPNHEALISDGMDWETYRFFAVAARERATFKPVVHNHSSFLKLEVVEPIRSSLAAQAADLIAEASESVHEPTIELLNILSHSQGSAGRSY